MRVLLADDDAVFRDRLAEELRVRIDGIEVVAVVGDGHQAVAAALAYSPDAVLIDYAMPGPDGGHAAAVIRQALPAARIIILTGREPGELDNVPRDVEVVRKDGDLDSTVVRLLLA